MGTEGLIYELIEEIPEKEVVVVLGAAAYGDRLSDVLRDRVDTGIELYEAKKVHGIVMTGAANETRAMIKYALEKGVPEVDVHEDPKGVNTLASIRNLNPEESVIIVTQKFHLPRALFMAKHLGINAIGMIADKHQYTKIFEFKKREILATSKAMLDLFVGN